MTDSRIPADVLERHLAGETTPEEQAIVEVWLRGYPAASDVSNLLREATAPARQDSDVQWTALQSRMHSEGSPFRPVGPPARQRRLNRLVIGATICALAIGFGLFQVSTQPAATTYRTDRTEYTTITLPDSSRVTLAPESHLTVSTGFGSEDRSVSLVGEGYFDVTPSSTHPFQIRTSTITTRVLGTTFSVRHYDGDSAVRVAVETGKVASGGTSSYAVLSAGAVALITDSTATQLPAADVKTYTSWVDGQLVFNDAPIPEMLATMGRWYGFTFQLADSTLAHRHVTAMFNVNQSESTMAELARLLNVTMQRSGRVVTLHPRRRSVADRDSHTPPSRMTPAVQAGDRAANTPLLQVGQ